MIGKDRDVPVTGKRLLRVGTSVARHLYLVDPENPVGKHEEEIGFTIALEDGPLLAEAFNAAQWGPGDGEPPRQIEALLDKGRAEDDRRVLVPHGDSGLWYWGRHRGRRSDRLHDLTDPIPWAEVVKDAIVLVPVPWDPWTRTRFVPSVLSP